MENGLSVIPINLTARGGLPGVANQDHRALPSEGRGWHGFVPFMAIYGTDKPGTRGERRENKGTLHRSCTGAAISAGCAA
jgi:hypothetical protein